MLGRSRCVALGRAVLGALPASVRAPCRPAARLGALTQRGCHLGLAVGATRHRGSRACRSSAHGSFSLRVSSGISDSRSASSPQLRHVLFSSRARRFSAALISSRVRAVLEVLGGPHDRVDDRPDEGKQRCGGGGGRPASGRRAAGSRPSTSSRRANPDHDQEEDQQVDGQVQAVVLDSKEGERHCVRSTERKTPCTERVPQPVEAYRSKRPRPYPRAKNTRITTATTRATTSEHAGVLGQVACSPALRRARDRRAGRSSRWRAPRRSGPASSRARASGGPRGDGSTPGRDRRAGARGLERRRPAAAGMDARVKTTCSNSGSSVASIPVASLSSRIAITPTTGAALDDLGERVGQRARALVGLWAPSKIVSGSSRDDLMRPGSLDGLRGVAHGGQVERPVGTPRRPRRATAKLRRWNAPRGAQRHAGVVESRRHDQARVALARRRARRPRAPRSPSRAATRASPWSRTTASFSSAMSALGRAEPARVLEPDVGQHLHRRAGSRWSRRSGRRDRPRSPRPRPRRRASSQ